MRLIRWNSLLPTVSRETPFFQDEFNRLFDGYVTRGAQRGSAPLFVPAVDIEESPDEFIVRADLPGLDQKDVKVNLMGDTLTIRGERKQETTRKENNAHRVERSHGAFERAFTFDAPVKSEGIKAQYRDGVLEVVVPKAEEAKIREIEVQVAS